MSKNNNKNKTDEKYKKVQHREHVLLRPDSYVGDIEPITNSMFICKKDKLIKEEVIKYYEDIDENGNRRIRKETAETRYNRGAKNFPQKLFLADSVPLGYFRVLTSQILG